MIKIINDDLYLKMIAWFKNHVKNHNKILNEDLLVSLKYALVDRAYLAYYEDGSGFVVLYPYDDNIALNPWFLGGYPIGEGAEYLIDEAVIFFNKTAYKRLEMIGPSEYFENKNIPMDLSYQYVDLIKVIEKTDLPDEAFVSISDIREEDLKAVYHDAFSGSDAKFYSFQSRLEKKEFWTCLHYELAVKEKSSTAIFKENELVGFVFSYDNEGHKHISCMCIKKKFQHQGYGTKILQHVLYYAYLEGYKYLTLGTEKTMKAYDLYKSFGFEIKNTKSYFIKIK
ncbi:GNAT family N-acetyltransferase [Acidaminobacter sp. JC074]|uniref:GNAT family N-acetyltransferase n=1 Tax=Acidaminobacter sp. JC074 TaxID=2530199 RepID=UPI001F11191A|nr:GNAT family N-acetyltransferase [Acidaminobacter sp. JC074]